MCNKCGRKVFGQRNRYIHTLQELGPEPVTAVYHVSLWHGDLRLRAKRMHDFVFSTCLVFFSLLCFFGQGNVFQHANFHWSFNPVWNHHPWLIIAPNGPKRRCFSSRKLMLINLQRFMEKNTNILVDRQKTLVMVTTNSSDICWGRRNSIQYQL